MNENRRAHRALRYLRSLWNSLGGSARTAIAGCTGLGVGVLVAYGFASNADTASEGLLPHSVTVAARTEDDSLLFRVVVIAQRADCSSNLNHLAFLNRVAIAPHIVGRFILLAGPPSDTMGLRPLLPPVLQHADIAILRPDQERLLRSLGHSESPTMALYDNRNRLLVVSATPPDPFQRTVFVRALARIITGNPTP